MCERYNGWANRETWALNLWLENDQGLYEMTRERVRAVLADRPLPEWVDGSDAVAVRDNRAWVAGDAIAEMWSELTDPDEGLMPAGEILEVVRDVGSEYRVDWAEIGAHWLEDES